MRWALGLFWSTRRAIFGGLVIALAVQTTIPVAQALAVRNLVDSLVASVGRDAGRESVLLWLVVSMGAIVLGIMVRYVHEYLSACLLDDLGLEIPSRVLEHASRLDHAFFESPESQDLLERLRTNAAPHVHRFLTSLMDGAVHGAQVVLLLILLASIEPLIVPVLALLAIPYAVHSGRLAGRRFSVEYTRVTQRRWTSYFFLCLTDRDWVGEVRLLGLAPTFRARFRELVEGFRGQDRRVHRHRLLGRLCFGAVAAAALCGTMVRVALRVVSGALTVGDFTLVLGSTHRLLGAAESAIRGASAAYEQALFVSDLDEFLRSRPVTGIREPPEGAPPPHGEAARIELRHVTFAYPGQAEPVLRDVSFAIGPGETVAIVGENGAGKSTLVKLVARLYDPDAGAILLDGVDLRDLPSAALRRRVAFSMQSVSRYEATAGDNLAFGDWARLSGDPAAIEDAARRTGVSELIDRLPDRFDTFLGRRFGERDLSGGEWTRLAVARALVRDAALVILDEPTAGLDTRTEHELYLRFRELSGGRTTILVSHRFSTVGLADRILVLDRGRLVEEGTHEELLARGGRYASLFRLHLAHAVPGGEGQCLYSPGEHP